TSAGVPSGGPASRDIGVYLAVTPLRRLLAKRVVDLLLDVAVVLAKRLFFGVGEEPERDANRTLRELHVQPVLTVLRAARHVEVELTHAGAVVGDIGLIPWHRAGIKVGEEPEPVHTVGPGWEVIDRVPLDLHALLQHLDFRFILPVLCDRRQ